MTLGLQAEAGAIDQVEHIFHGRRVTDIERHGVAAIGEDQSGRGVEHLAAAAGRDQTEVGHLDRIGCRPAQPAWRRGSRAWAVNVPSAVDWRLRPVWPWRSPAWTSTVRVLEAGVVGDRFAAGGAPGNELDRHVVE